MGDRSRSALAYVIEYSPESEDHLRFLTTAQQRRTLDTVDRQLRHQPNLETRNRKPMRPNPIAPWELRIGEIRVYYDVIESPHPVVSVLAIGLKKGNVVRIGGEIVSL